MTRKLGRVARGVKRDYLCSIVCRMRVVIEYCVICNYEPRAAGLAADVRKTYPQADVKLIQASGGVFEVEVDGRKVFSKQALGRHAAAGEVMRLISEAQPPD